MHLVETLFLLLFLLNFTGAIYTTNNDEDESFHDLSGVHLRVAIANVRLNLNSKIICSDFEIQFIIFLNCSFPPQWRLSGIQPVT